MLTTVPDSATPVELEKKSAYHHKDLRQALLATALVLTVERKAPAFSLRELAARLGVSHTSVYRHFADKANLLDALAAEGFRKLIEYQQAELDKVGDDPLQQLHALGSAYVRFAQENEGFFVLMFSADLASATDDSARKPVDETAFGNLISAISRCQQAGIVIDADPMKIASYLVLAPHGLAFYAAQGSTGRFARDYGRGDFAYRIARLALAPLLTKPLSAREVKELLG